MACAVSAQDKVLYRGQTARFVLTVVDEDGDRYDLTAATLYLRIKASVSDADPALIELATGTGITNKVQSGATLGQADVVITGAQMATLTGINYYYDVWLESAGGDVEPVIPVSRLTVPLPVTNLSDPPPGD